MKRFWILPAAWLLALSGCGDDGDNDSSSQPTDEPTAASSYVAEINQLCTALIDEVVPITGNAAPIPTRERFLSDREQLAPIYEAFEADVAAVPAETEEDEAAKAAFDAYLVAIHAADADLIAKAESLNDAKFAKAIDESFDTFFTSPERTAMLDVGIECPGR